MLSKEMIKISHPMKSQGKKIVVILGGGFAGLTAAKHLCCHDELYVILIDQKNHHLFQPLLYQVATAGLNPSDIAAPIRNQFSYSDNIEVHMARIDSVDLHKKSIRSLQLQKEFEFDYLILACGATHSYFSRPDWEDFAPGLKTLEQATEIRRRILSAFEEAENELNSFQQRALLNFVVVGGGPTGVELAGAIADISRSVIVHDFKRIDPSRAHVLLAEGGPRILPSFSEKLSTYAKKALTDMGVDVRTSSLVTEVNEHGVRIGEEFVPSKTVLWAAGVLGNPIQIFPEVQKDRSGKIFVESDLSLPGHPDVFVVGDLAAVKMPSGSYVPGLAPAAIQQGKHAARLILASVRNKKRSAFRFIDKGQMATIGKNKAVLQMGKFYLTGRLAWWGWLWVHIFFLIGFKNRVAVLATWAWSYIFSKRGARLITEKNWKIWS